MVQFINFKILQISYFKPCLNINNIILDIEKFSKFFKNNLYISINVVKLI
ncbi:hypothetical protein GCWU000323_02330 [Leptotrichia hofstadii F0254]|uniref:Uncharacterized protein n=1 Tax=Leptotrichia hofstadii F0254 TaxID=634994 RepID=C9N0G5_9FUSO|nr:hypothetical protein GCWU000323_02330 [Leptotrichia hofstadii F0254]